MLDTGLYAAIRFFDHSERDPQRMIDFAQKFGGRRVLLAITDPGGKPPSDQVKSAFNDAAKKMAPSLYQVQIGIGLTGIGGMIMRAMLCPVIGWLAGVHVRAHKTPAEAIAALPKTRQDFAALSGFDLRHHDAESFPRFLQAALKSGVIAEDEVRAFAHLLPGPRPRFASTGA